MLAESVAFVQTTQVLELAWIWNCDLTKLEQALYHWAARPINCWTFTRFLMSSHPAPGCFVTRWWSGACQLWSGCRAGVWQLHPSFRGPTLITAATPILCQRVFWPLPKYLVIPGSKQRFTVSFPNPTSFPFQTTQTYIFR